MENKEDVSSEEKSGSKFALPNISRRNFLVASGAATVVAGMAAAGVAGHANATSAMTYTGLEKESFDEDERFNRKPYERDKMPFNQVGTPRRINVLSNVSMYRRGNLGTLWGTGGQNVTTYLTNLGITVDNYQNATHSMLPNMNPTLREYYDEIKRLHGYDYFVDDLKYQLIITPQTALYRPGVERDFILHNAFYAGMQATNVASSVTSKTTDLPSLGTKRRKFKSPEHASKVIKKVGKLFGSPIVRIAKFNPNYVYDRGMGRRGYGHLEPIEIPDRWKYSIVLGAPMEWESFPGNPYFAHSYDGYANAGMYAARMVAYLKSLGYSARENSPIADYEMPMTPIAVEAGCGEQGRHGCCITPEFGANFRPSVVVTDLELEPDKPINLNLRKFCQNCKICAESCPSGAISFDDVREMNGNGYDGWNINLAFCNSFWAQVVGTVGCRVCIAVCPFSKRSNWIHRAARNLAIHDKTGVAASVLSWMEKTFYGAQDPQHFYYKGDNIYGIIGKQAWFFDVDSYMDEK